MEAHTKQHQKDWSQWGHIPWAEAEGIMAQRAKSPTRKKTRPPDFMARQN